MLLFLSLELKRTVHQGADCLILIFILLVHYTYIKLFSYRVLISIVNEFKLTNIHWAFAYAKRNHFSPFKLNDRTSKIFPKYISSTSCFSPWVMEGSWCISAMCQEKGKPWTKRSIFLKSIIWGFMYKKGVYKQPFCILWSRRQTVLLWALLWAAPSTIGILFLVVKSEKY